MTTHDDLSALLQQGTREYTSLYERHAYRVYNLALRTACAREPALKAAEEAFLTQAGGAAAEGNLLHAAATFAMREADAGAPAEGAGGAEAEAMLRATARLPAPERAALALSHLAGAGADGIATVLSLTPDAAEAVLDRAYEGLAAALSVSADDARGVYDGWLLAEPPAALWERVYPRFYTQLEKEARAAAGASLGPVARTRRAAGGAVEQASTRRARRRAARGERRPRRLLRPRTAVLLVAAAAATFGALQYTGVGGDDEPDFAALADGEIPGVDEDNAEDVARSDGDPYDPLTPRELDKLRLEELKDLRARGEEEQAKELERRRKAARREAAEARRQRASERRRTLLERKRAERERRLAARAHRQAAQREQRAPRSSPQPPREDRGDSELGVTIEEHRSGTGGGSGDSGSGDGPSRDEARDRCLYDEESGTYMCPD